MVSSKSYRVAVVGATGVVGEMVLRLLHERKFPVKQVFALASQRSVGESVLFGNKSIDIEDLATFDFSQADIAFFSVGAQVSATYAPIAASAGCIVIDKSSQFRQDADVPLIVPEVNPSHLELYKNRRIIANPNCSTIPMVMALKPLYDAVGISRINVATYQSVSGTGKDAVLELATQTGSLLNGHKIKPEIYAKQIAFNVIPHIDDFADNGYTLEELKMLHETRKIFGDDTVSVNATTVRVPVFFGHSLALHIETRDKITREQAARLIKAMPGVKILDTRKSGGYPTPVGDAADNDTVWVGRIREDITHEHGLNLWVVSDNIRKGAATNGIQIAELLVESFL